MSAAPYPIVVLSGFDAYFADVPSPYFRLAARWDGKASASGSPDFDEAAALVVSSIINVPAELLARMPKLQLICCFGAGYDGVPLDLVRQRNLTVTHSPGANAGAVAEMAVGLLLSVSRRIAEGDRFVREQRWPQGQGVRVLPVVQGIEGARIGIAGMGTVGSNVASRILPFGTEIGYVNPSPRPGLPYRRFDDIRALAEWADVLVVCARSGKDSRHLIDRDVLAALGPQGILVNVSRGDVVDEEALLDVLENGKIAGAGLDVFLNEPNVQERFMRLSNVVLSPHVAGRTIGAYQSMARMVIGNLEAFFSGQAVPNLIPPLRKT